MSNTTLSDLYAVCTAWEESRKGELAKAADTAADCFSFETKEEKARFAAFYAGYMSSSPKRAEPPTDNEKPIEGVVDVLPKASTEECERTAYAMDAALNVWIDWTRHGSKTGNAEYDTKLLLAAIYDAGRMQGIREESSSRREGSRP